MIEVRVCPIEGCRREFRNPSFSSPELDIQGMLAHGRAVDRQVDGHLQAVHGKTLDQVRRAMLRR